MEGGDSWEKQNCEGLSYGTWMASSFEVVVVVVVEIAVVEIAVVETVAVVDPNDLMAHKQK